jgi:hypothetical protein
MSALTSPSQCASPQVDVTAQCTLMALLWGGWLCGREKERRAVIGLQRERRAGDGFLDCKRNLSVITVIGPTRRKGRCECVGAVTHSDVQRHIRLLRWLNLNPACRHWGHYVAARCRAVVAGYLNVHSMLSLCLVYT